MTTHRTLTDDQLAYLTSVDSPTINGHSRRCDLRDSAVCSRWRATMRPMSSTRDRCARFTTSSGWSGWKYQGGIAAKRRRLRG